MTREACPVCGRKVDVRAHPDRGLVLAAHRLERGRVAAPYVWTFYCDGSGRPLIANGTTSVEQAGPFTG